MILGLSGSDKTVIAQKIIDVKMLKLLIDFLFRDFKMSYLSSLLANDIFEFY